jgi:hypothetical protein
MDVFNALTRLKIIPFLERWNLLNLILGLIDILAIAFAYQVAFMLNYYNEGIIFLEREDLTYIFLTIVPLWLITLYIIKVTEIPRTKKYRTLLIEYFQSAVAISLILMVFYFVFKLGYLSRLFLTEFTFTGFLLLFFVRVLEYKVFKLYRAKGFNYVNLLKISGHTKIGVTEYYLFFPVRNRYLKSTVRY